MLARSNTGTLGPPARPSASYAQPPRNPGFDESLRLPPLQTQLPTSPTQGSDSSGGPSASAPTGLGIVVRDLRESQARSIEAMVMSIPYINKLKVLGKISPPLGPPGPSSPAVETRGPVLALEGRSAALVKAVSVVIEKSLASSGECAVRTWSANTPPADTGSDDAEMVDGQSPEMSKSRTTSVSSGSSSSNPFGKYLQTIMEWHGKSDDIIKHVTTKPTGEQSDNAVDKTAASSQLPVALITDGFSLTLSDKFASSVPIADSYAPVDHWQWMATLWRGIIGPDLVIYVRSATEDEVNTLGGVDFKSAGIMIVRVNESKGLDEKTERRLGFEVMEWVRAGTFKEGFGRE
ncbi:putative hmg box protein [Phaeoacremonium minimum UCRPA7]|uniref:Putative hmg box protein n=1 Tax=Phaeoacremonium minimum (strain UCR-PA7) TaxID=1286976 RepID=R8BAE2_PHAM7|nr:putative hmg box protein [Phaeoacremonium minimum UCRPA7]EON96261.1 putative hmg box protein [Phaeoacremonium minimum UCRPA7]